MKSPLTKDIRYIPYLQPDAVSNDIVREYVLECIRQDAAGNLREFSMQLRQKREGNQMWVSKQVSDDLALSDIEEFDFHNLEWPYPTLEFFFEDPALPSALFHKRKSGENFRYLEQASGLSNLEQIFGLKRDNTDDVEVYDLFMQRESDSLGFATILTASVIDDYAARGFSEEQLQELDTDIDYGAAEAECMAQLKMTVALIYKVLLFAASEGCAPRKTAEQPTKKQGGKAGFKGRPRTPRMIIEYLPRHRKERKDQASEATGKTHEFNGRRGHWRVYKSDRYVRMRGKRVFIYPIPDKNGNYPKRQFRVVRPR